MLTSHQKMSLPVIGAKIEEGSFIIAPPPPPLYLIKCGKGSLRVNGLAVTVKSV